MSDEAGPEDPGSANAELSEGEPEGSRRRSGAPGSGPGVDVFRADRLEEDEALAAELAREMGGPRLQWPSMLVLLGLVGSLLVVADDHFRRGSVLFAAFVVLAFFLRLILSDRDAGWLAVRSRAVDLAFLAGLGLSLSVFALVVPSPS